MTLFCFWCLRYFKPAVLRPLATNRLQRRNLADSPNFAPGETIGKLPFSISVVALGFYPKYMMTRGIVPSLLPTDAYNTNISRVAFRDSHQRRWGDSLPRQMGTPSYRLPGHTTPNWLGFIAFCSRQVDCAHARTHYTAIDGFHGEGSTLLHMSAPWGGAPPRLPPSVEISTLLFFTVFLNSDLALTPSGISCTIRGAKCYRDLEGCSLQSGSNFGANAHLSVVGLAAHQKQHKRRISRSLYTLSWASKTKVLGDKDGVSGIRKFVLVFVYVRKAQCETHAQYTNNFSSHVFLYKSLPVPARIRPIALQAT